MKKGLLVLVMIILAFNSYGQAGMEYYKIGKQKAENKDFHGAIMSFTTALEMEDHEKFPQVMGTYFLERGNSKQELSDFRGAISDLSASIGWFTAYVHIAKKNNANLHPSTADLFSSSYASRAFAKLGMNDLDAALLDITEALVFSPRSGNLFELRGLIQIRLGLKDSACLDFSRAGELGVEGAYELIKEWCN